MKNEKPNRSQEEESAPGEAGNNSNTVGSTEAARVGRDPSKDESRAKEERAANSNAATSSKETPQKKALPAKKPETPVTEKPVPLSPPKRTSQYVITVDNATGLPTRIEKLSSDTGERTELSKDEYLQVVSSASQPSLNCLGLGSSVGVPATNSNALAQAYYKGIVDYLNTVCPT